MTTLSDHDEAQALGNQVVTSHELSRLAANIRLLITKVEANQETGTILLKQLQSDVTAYDLLQEEVSDMPTDSPEAK